MLSRGGVRIAVSIALVSLLSYLCGFYITGLFHGASARTGGLWAVLSGNTVLQETRRQTWSTAWRQVLGTLVGAVISTAFLAVLPFSAVVMAASIFVTVLFCHAARIPDHARLAAPAVGVVMVVSSLHPTLHPILNAALRLGEACVGTAMATLVIMIWPEPKAPPHNAVS